VGAVAYILAIFPASARASFLMPALILLALAATNFLGTRISGRVMTFANLLKIFVLFSLAALAFLPSHGSMANLVPLVSRHPGSEAILPAIAAATINAFFSFGGWWEVGKLAGEVRDPQKNLPRAFTIGVLLVTAIYLLISFAFLYVVPLRTIVSNTAFVAQFGNVLFGAAGGKVLSLCVLLCVLGGLMALTMACPRVYYAMARDGAFFPAFGRLHPRFQTPANAIALQTGLALLLLLLGGFDRILAYIIFSAVIFLGLSVASLFRLKQPVRRWWYPAAPIIFLFGCFVIGILILMHDPLPALLGVAMVLSGALLRRFFLPTFRAQPSAT
jgi:APA family basic amino acid/polyamine antiporter